MSYYGYSFFLVVFEKSEQNTWQNGGMETLKRRWGGHAMGTPAALAIFEVRKYLRLKGY